MIRVLVKKKKESFAEICVQGHAMYDDYGKDIVCAGASTIFITTVNAILRFNDKAIVVEQKKDLVCLKVLQTSEIIKTLLDNMIDLFSELSLKYPKNITIREDELNE